MAEAVEATVALDKSTLESPVRSRSRSRSPAVQTRGRSRSPSRRKSLNRSPSPHRYNTRNSQLQQEEEVTNSSGCSLTATLKDGWSRVSNIAKQCCPLFLEVSKFMFGIVVIYVATTMCSFGKCRVRWPDVPVLTDLYSEDVFLLSVTSFLFFAVVFCIPLGQGVQGVCTERGRLTYLCNSPAALIFCLATQYLGYKYYPTILFCGELPVLFSCVLVFLIVAFCNQWKFKSFGLTYNVVFGLTAVSLVDERFQITGYPLYIYTVAILCFVMALIFRALLQTVFSKPDTGTSNFACRGLLVLATTWYLRHDHFTLPEKACFINTSVWMILGCVAFILLCLVLKHQECAKASALLVLSLALVTGMLIHQEYLVVPSEFPLLSLWFVFNIGSALDATFVIARMSWRTNFFGVKPVEFLSQMLEGSHDPRFRLGPFPHFDIKFFSIRLGLICPLLFCAQTGFDRHTAGTLSCPVASVMSMTVLYIATKLICLEKAHTSSTAMVDQKCGVGFMLWKVCAQPVLVLMPLQYLLSAGTTDEPGAPVEGTASEMAPLYSCCAVTWLLCGTYTLGLILYTLSTLQGHFLIIGESHVLTKSLTTIVAAGEEKIPVSGHWRFMRYPFITGELMVLASIALTCGLEGSLVFLPFTVQLLHSIKRVVSYNRLSPAFYGVRAWKSYQEMVKYNVVPGVW